MRTLLGFDVGSSSIKATLIGVEDGRAIASATSPATEMAIHAPRAGWAEQYPAVWWEHVVACAAQLKTQIPEAWEAVAAIGIAYQMHGLVLVDRERRVLRPSIIWCDSRAVEIGACAAERIGTERCLDRLLNLPGNFTASKLRWVRENEPEVYGRIHRMMLPGDWIAMQMTDRVATTASGLSEGILWDFKGEGLAGMVLEDYDIDPELIPEQVETFSVQGELTKNASGQLGLRPGIPIAYRAGDQPNNALSLGVLEPGQMAATAGTSGVVCGIIDQPHHDPPCRVNSFVHVNHSPGAARYAVLLCLNGAGILNSWMKRHVADPLDYEEMNALAADAPIGSDGLCILPFGNGAERMLGNRNLGASMHGLNFNIHTRAHLLRAAQEGIAFALRYGVDIMRSMGMELRTVRAGRANMFLSPLFREAFATLTGAQVELFDTDGSQGAARGAGLGAGIYASPAEAFASLERLDQINPNPAQEASYREAYERWRLLLI